ncbi:MAG: hypothetical protein RL264_1680 [Bacteroidota bacterium]|jgi:ABC-type Fe3+ transport system substrate-binding protein
MRFLWVLSLVLVACASKSVRIEKRQEVVIGSDFLRPSDKHIFSRFERKTKIQVRIQSLSADELAHVLDSQGYSCPYDMLMVRSLTSVKKIPEKALHPLPQDFFSDPVACFRTFRFRKWLVLGIDPYIFSLPNDSLRPAENYADLRKRNWTTPNADQLRVFYAHLRYRYSSEPKAFNNLLKELKQHLIPFSATDSLQNRTLQLLTWSETLAFSTKRKERLFFPNETKGGYYADRKCIAVIRQARNFENAKELLNYIPQFMDLDFYAELFGVLPHPDFSSKLKLKELNFFRAHEDSLLRYLMK